MYFKRLEIFGFKSFSDKTVLNFGPGITAVVGPNGCGKSNVFDSIRWVLGEQSVKELRGDSMEDVIFSGTDKKPGLGFAEVSLTFSNESKMLPVEYNEVTVTRRLFRSGESEYLMNKTVVRLRDIQELFMGTGIGAEAYSLVQQGKVDLVVSARPEDRRVILDEASGITKYKSKKKEALGKLKDTENNLLRINDIVIEVKRQIASIERQANKARRYKEEFDRLKVFEVRLARHQLDSFAEDKNKIVQLLAELNNKEEKFKAETARLNDLLSHEEGVLSDLEQKTSDANSDEIKLKNQIDIEERQIGFNDERLENLALHESRLGNQKAQLLERCRKEQERIEELKAALATLSETMQKNLEELRAKKEHLGVVANLIHTYKETIHQDEGKIFEQTSQQVKLNNELTEIIKEVQGALARKRRLELESTKVLSEKEEVDERFKNITRDIESTLNKISDITLRQESKQLTLNELKSRLAFLQQTISELEKKKFLLVSQKEFIEKLRVQYQDIPDPVIEGRLITRVAPSEKHTGMIGKVKSVSSTTAELYEIICETKFIELDPQEILARITEVNLELDAQGKQREETIERMNQDQKEVDGFLEEVRAQEKSLSIFESQKHDILKDVNKLNGELELVDLEIKEARELLTSLKEKEDGVSAKLNVSNEEIQWRQQHIKEKQQAIEGKSKEREETTVAIAQLETEIESFKDKQKSQEENLKMFSETLDAGLEEMKTIDDELAGTEVKRQKINEETENLKLKIEDLKKKKESLKEVLKIFEKERADINQRLESIHRQITAAENDMEALKNEAHNTQLKEQEIVFSERSIKDRLMQTYKIDVDQALLEELPNPLSAQAAQVPPEAAPPTHLSVEELIAEIERLKKRCESFGSVNLVAIDEFEELRQRFEFLTKQQSDLLTAKESLHETIIKINRTCRQMFMDTFTKVSEEFRVYFRMLFGGGEAQLVLLDPENVLESGIEIIARPPGKKLQNISLLSGGEKTLTAIALIFGVFKVKPSPFCVLDEIDAALDESNIGRFGYLLKDFAKITQFIVITHNKKTIAHADVMYGITMQETGVSKIVSVKFAEDQKADAREEIPVGV